MVTFNWGEEVASLAAANAEPKMLAPKNPEIRATLTLSQDVGTWKWMRTFLRTLQLWGIMRPVLRNALKPTRTMSGMDILTKEERLEKLFSKLDLCGVQSWSTQDRNDVTSLIEEYHHLFVLDVWSW